MEAVAPALLSGLAEKLLRRPPSLRELVTLIGYADDYAWFAGLVRRLFPDEAEAALSAPDTRRRVGAVRQSLRGAALPTLRSVHRVLAGRGGGRPSLDLPEEGDPLRPDGIRLRRRPRDVARLPRGSLGPRSAGPASRFLLRGRRRDKGGLAGVGRYRHSARDPAPHPPKRHTPGRPHRGGQGDEVRGRRSGRFMGLRRDRQLLPGRLLRRRGVRRVRRPLGGRDHRRRHGGVAQGQRPHGLGGEIDRLAGGGPPRPLRRVAGLRSAPAPQTSRGGKRT